MKLLLAILMLCFASLAQAEIIDIGSYHGEQWKLDVAETKHNNDNQATVLMLTNSPHYRMGHKDYMFMAAHMTIDCSSHAYALIAAITFNKQGFPLEQFYHELAPFFPIKENPIMTEVSRMSCRMT